MKALTWQGTETVSVETVPDPHIEQPNDAIVRVTSTAICGSDLHLYTLLGPYLEPGDVLGHEFMGIVEEVGPEAGDLMVGVYGGAADPMEPHDDVRQERHDPHGQANVRHWTDELLTIVSQDEDVLGLETLATHHPSLDDAPAMYELFQKKQDGCIKVVMKPGA